MGTSLAKNIKASLIALTFVKYLLHDILIKTKAMIGS